MIRSMTGFAKIEKDWEGAKITGEARSLNNRYLEVAVKLPRTDYILEQRLRELVKRYLRRGKVDVTLRWEKPLQGTSEVRINDGVLRQYLTAAGTLKETYGLAGEISLEHALSLKDLFVAEENNVSPEDGLMACCEELMEALTADRAREGALIAGDFQTRLDRVMDNIAVIETRWPDIMKAHEQRLRARLTEVTGGMGVDESRLLQELALYMERSDIAEEVVRLKGHTDHFREIIGHTDAVGRKLDFLIQEMVRETNTIGSKSQDLFTGERVVEIKVEIEKLREQTQNVE